MEMMEDLLLRQIELRQRIEEDGAKEHLFRELNEVNKALGEREETYDPLWEKWERELAEGKIPDLDEMAPDPEDW